MFCRLVESSVAADKIDVAMESLKSSVTPRLEGIPGFQGAYWFADRESGRVLAATFYDSRESVEASRDMATRIRTEGMAAAGVEFKGVREMEVVAETGEKISNTATHARVTESTSDPANGEIVIGVIKSMVIPQAQAWAGFAGGFWILDRETGEGLGATLWESEEAMRQTSSQSADLRSKAGSEGGFKVAAATEMAIVVRAETPAAAGA